MKLIINYDFFNSINNINNAGKGFVVVKCKSKYWVKKKLPFFTLTALITLLTEKEINESDIMGILFIIATFYGFSVFSALIEQRAIGIEESTLNEIKKNKQQLLKLSSQLQNLNISTNYELLLQSELYYKTNSIVKDEEEILPSIMEKKYINIPSYDSFGDVKEVSIEQEHIIGSKDYVLTLGSPSKSFKLATQGV